MYYIDDLQLHRKQWSWQRWGGGKKQLMPGYATDGYYQVSTAESEKENGISRSVKTVRIQSYALGLKGAPATSRL